jgi:hypothetical protein
MALALCMGSVACGGRDLVLVRGAHWEDYVYDNQRDSSEQLGSLTFRDKVCAGQELAPPYSHLDENDLITFLQRRNLKVSVERPRGDLAYVVVDDARTRRPARLRVAILSDADDAGRELAEALIQHGEGSWGVHRANLAVLGPVGDTTHDLTFAAEIGLACWGVFTIRGKTDTYVIPGAYREL